MKKSIIKTTSRSVMVLTMLGLAHYAAAEPSESRTSKEISTLKMNARAKDGFYITPGVEVFFVDKFYTHNLSPVGLGGGFNVSTGYRIKNFLIDLDFSYQLYGGSSKVGNTFARTGNGGLIRLLMPSIADGVYITNTTSRESFMPLTLGLKYAIPLLSNRALSITPGIAAGVWFHSINRSLSYSDNMDGQLAKALETFSTLQPGAVIPTGDKASEIKAVIVPSLALDYSPSEHVTFTFTGKFYIVPKGYSDNYNPVNRAAALNGIGTFENTYTLVDKLFWYGGINFGWRYTF